MSEQTVELDVGCHPTAGSAEPILVQSDLVTLLFFSLPEGEEDWAGETPGQVAVARFEGCLLTKFGYPNDEALSGVTLYAFSEVLGSEWAASLKRRQEADRDRMNHQKYEIPLKRHFVVSLHDSTFECLADGVSVTVKEGGRHEVASGEMKLV
jgi:hypothetical protein